MERRYRRGGAANCGILTINGSDEGKVVSNGPYTRDEMNERHPADDKKTGTEMTRNQIIGVFDSGFGGLTVLKALT